MNAISIIKRAHTRFLLEYKLGTSYALSQLKGVDVVKISIFNVMIKGS
ncbi:MAG: hypothetical protein P4M11_09440 [Candidatus Pacebacteria bacterium]|nr:hypothetical protein [Candidatus Paceibacterota bacterium]